MGEFQGNIKPFEGKTYTLFGKGNTTTRYYQVIALLADQVLDRYKDIEAVLKNLQKYSNKRHSIEKKARENEGPGIISFFLHHLDDCLKEFTEKADAHVKGLPILKLWDRRLGTTRKQYHLFMLEIELTNRLNREKFRSANKKIALLPYCLRDFKVDCKAAPDDFDYQCKHCSRNCYQNQVSLLLHKNDIDAYIWMGADIKKKLVTRDSSNTETGILGIACIPELVWGMRKCLKYNIPVVGIPLDANRCIRWMGSFNENSVNLEMLEKLICKQTSP
jgi:hypothetical protein